MARVTPALMAAVLAVAPLAAQPVTAPSEGHATPVIAGSGNTLRVLVLCQRG